MVLVEIFYTLRWLKLLAIGGAVSTGLFYFASMIAYPALCAPTNGTSAKDYQEQLASKRCHGSFALGITVGVVSVISDLYLILLPLPAVWGLQLPLRRRLGISAMFLVGLMYVIAEQALEYDCSRFRQGFGSQHHLTRLPDQSVSGARKRLRVEHPAQLALCVRHIHRAAAYLTSTEFFADPA